MASAKLDKVKTFLTLTEEHRRQIIVQTEENTTIARTRPYGLLVYTILNL